MKQKLIAVLLSISLLLTACEGARYTISEANEGLNGIRFVIDTFDNYGNLNIKTSGKHISAEANRIAEYGYNSDGSWVKNYSMSSVITVYIDGKELETCGDSCIFYEVGLEPDVEFDPSINIQSSEDGILTAPLIAGKINMVKNIIGKPRVVIIKSQLGNPIYVFSGDSVYWEVAEELPKFTKISIDGKLLYIHRANFQIIDKSLL
jgi:hypothetical protein